MNMNMTTMRKDNGSILYKMPIKEIKRDYRYVGLALLKVFPILENSIEAEVNVLSLTADV